MPPRPVPTSRRSAVVTSAATCVLALLTSVAARVSMPSRLQELSLFDRSVNTRVDVLGAARQRFEVDMRGEIGLAGIL